MDYVCSFAQIYSAYGPRDRVIGKSNKAVRENYHSLFKVISGIIKRRSTMLKVKMGRTEPVNYRAAKIC